MTIWIDAQLSPSLALWINQNFEGIEARSLWALGLRNALDMDIFQQAKKAPAIILVTCGNTSNARMRGILSKKLNFILELIKGGEPLVEITGD